MENRSSGDTLSHWAYRRYWRPTPKKANNENENPSLEATQAETSTKRKRSKRQKKLHQNARKNTTAENTSNVLQNKRNLKTNTLKDVKIIHTQVFNSTLDLSSNNKIKHENLIFNPNAKPSKYVALDCEMVAGLGYPPRYRRVSLAARVSLVNEHLECIYNQYVKPGMKVVDYGTRISGVTKQHLDNYSRDFHVVQGEIASLLKGKVLVGHAVHYDMNTLYLNHPPEMIRDTAYYAPLTKYNRGKTPSLKVLAKEILGLDIQEGAHDSIIDASASMQLYLVLADEWEAYNINRKALEIQMKRLKDDVWIDKRKYSNAECRYYEMLAKKAKASKSAEPETSNIIPSTSVSNKKLTPVNIEIVNSIESNKQKRPRIISASSVTPGGSKADLNKSNPRNSNSEKFYEVPNCKNGSLRDPNTVQQAAYKNGDKNYGLKREMLKELSNAEKSATFYLQEAIEPLTVSLECLCEIREIYTKEKIGKQERRAERTEIDQRVDEIFKLVNAIKFIRNL